MPRLRQTVALALMTLTAGSLEAEPGRDYLIIVGSTTIYPFAEMVVERLVEKGDFETPMLQPLGTGGGLMLFCSGTDELDPDIALASRPIRQSELDRCRDNEVGEIVEVKIGYDGIVLSQSRTATSFSPSRKDIYLALAQFIPDPDGGDGFIDNPHKTWQDVNPELPATQIEVWGPGRGSGTRFMFRRRAMEEGCRTLDGMIELEEEDPWRYREVCRNLREDDAYVEVSEDDAQTIDSLQTHPHALALLSFGVVEAEERVLRDLAIDGIDPDVESIANGSYLLARPLYMYVKKVNVDVYPEIREFLAEFTNDAAFGSAGYLRARGLVPMRAEERSKYVDVANNLTPMQQ